MQQKMKKNLVRKLTDGHPDVGEFDLGGIIFFVNCNDKVVK